MNNQVLVLILGGGQGTRLFPLTQHRSKPAVPIAGQYRLIDIPISNCLHAEFRRIFAIPFQRTLCFIPHCFVPLAESRLLEKSNIR